MRILDWAEFSKMPEGTIFQELHSHNLGDLQVLAQVTEQDFVSAILMPTCEEGNSLERGHPMREKGLLICIPSGHGRDGLYEFARRKWLVWDETDRRRLASWLLDPVAASRTQNTDDVIYEVPA